jgi:trigger factor
MQVKQLKHNGLKYELEVTVEAGDIARRRAEQLQEVGKKVRIPGFRPGKVPANILDKKYGTAVMGDVLEQAVSETSQKALEDKGLQPAVQPKIEVKTFDLGKDLTYTIAVEVLPEVKVASYKGLKLTKPVAKADDKVVDQALERIAETRQQSEIVERAARKGDMVVIDFHGRTADDNKMHEGMHAHGHYLTLGGGQFIPGFEDQLIGKKAGDKAEVKVTFPKEYGAKELAGRDAIFDVDVSEVREAKKAEINDELAKSMGFDSVEALRKAVAEQAEKEFAVHSRMRLKRALLDQLDADHNFEIPEGMREQEYNSVIRQVQQDAMQRGGDGKLSSDEEKELALIAERRVRLGLVLSEIGKENNIKVTDFDMQKAVIAEARKFPGQEKQVFDYFSKNRQALEYLRAPVYEEKVVDLLLELAEITEQVVSVEDLTAEDEEEFSGPKTSEGKKKPAEKKAKDGDKPKKSPSAKKKS